MSGFKRANYKTKSEKKDADFSVTNEPKTIVRIEGYGTPSFSGATDSYEQARDRFGILADTDQAHQNLNSIQRQFKLSHLIKTPLHLEEEETRALEERVNTRFNELSNQVRKEAYDQGYQDGSKKGYEESFSAFQQEAEAKIEALQRLVQSFENAKTEIFRENEHFLIQLVFRIARLVLLKELQTDKEYIKRLCSEIIERMGVKDNITIRLSPNDIEVLQRLKEDLIRDLPDLKNLSIEASNLVKGGGCIIETQWNAIDASLDTQIERIQNAMGSQTGGLQAVG
jgi:flagellar biosynthesis/type III secretory pathway protein FliH